MKLSKFIKKTFTIIDDIKKKSKSNESVVLELYLNDNCEIDKYGANKLTFGFSKNNK